MTASTGKTGAGITLEIGDGGSPTAFTALGNVTNVNINGRTVDEVDFTHLGSTGGYREYRAGFKDAGTVTCTLHFDPTNVTFQDIETKLNSGDVFEFQINFSGAGWSYAYVGFGFVRGSDITANVDDPVSAELTIRLTGPLPLVAV